MPRQPILLYLFRGNSMKILAILIFLVLGWLQPLHSAITFTTVQQTPGPIVQGTIARFDILISENAGSVNLGGVDFGIEISGVANHGGIFTDGMAISSFTGGATATGGFFPNSFPSSAADFSNTIAGILAIGGTPVRIATIDLDTSIPGVIVGNYSLTLTPLANGIKDSGNNDLPVSASAYSTSYSISAVPEPTSIALIGFVGTLICVRRLRKRVVLRTTISR
jgi:hypothetical protein